MKFLLLLVVVAAFFLLIFLMYQSQALLRQVLKKHQNERASRNLTARDQTGHVQTGLGQTVKTRTLHPKIVQQRQSSSNATDGNTQHSPRDNDSNH